MSDQNRMLQLLKALKACVKDMNDWDIGHLVSCIEAESLIKLFMGDQDE